ncbi:hypothetical protein H634G_11297 [Metarhizium anisopliae BRIP 53293]|uniref:Uncharacterized protein n=1 Tax=Metarhizium anisopliae BRIP 53293 TaxID=1291518 RepID=A0A0D9NHH9_METAN|nr:hypothetical protein H634G_11297 [Metarhizium anisopliae BRIP 53293]
MISANMHCTSKMINGIECSLSALLPPIRWNCPIPIAPENENQMGPDLVRYAANDCLDKNKPNNDSSKYGRDQALSLWHHHGSVP